VRCGGFGKVLVWKMIWFADSPMRERVGLRD